MSFTSSFTEELSGIDEKVSCRPVT